jgi:GntR family transcriptional regulator/MocR family aminotransferase
MLGDQAFSVVTCWSLEKSHFAAKMWNHDPAQAAALTDLHLHLQGQALRRAARAQGISLQRQLYQSLKHLIASGQLGGGALLPASRALAQELGLSRNGVVHAYAQLQAEGYVQTTRQGTVVAVLPPHLRRPAGVAGALAALAAQTAQTARMAMRAAPGDKPGPAPAARPPLSQRTTGLERRRPAEMDAWPFMPGVPALDAFPMRRWCALVDRHARHPSPDDATYRDSQGEPELRQAIAGYLRASRGVVCDAEQVSITDGTQDSLARCAQWLADVGDTVWMEHPGYGAATAAFRLAGLHIRPCTVDAQGMQMPVDAGGQPEQPHPRLIYTTPSHQYPLGSVLSLARRHALIAHAQQVGAWILEDDYDSEFRHDGPPLAAMQGQVPDAPVVYLGTFSKTMFPALRLGFIVWPQALLHAAQGVTGAMVRAGRVAEQRALAAFIQEGESTRHLRRMRRLYAARQQALRQAIADHWPIPGRVWGGQAGLHLVLDLPQPHEGGVSDQALAAAVAAHRLSPRPLSAYLTGGPTGFNGLVIGYGNTAEAAMPAAIRQLAACLPPGPQRR